MYYEERLHGLESLVTWLPVIVIGILAFLCLLLILRSWTLGPFRLPRRRRRDTETDSEEEEPSPSERRSWFWPRPHKRR